MDESTPRPPGAPIKVPRLYHHSAAGTLDFGRRLSFSEALCSIPQSKDFCEPHKEQVSARSENISTHELYQHDVTLATNSICENDEDYALNDLDFDDFASQMVSSPIHREYSFGFKSNQFGTSNYSPVLPPMHRQPPPVARVLFASAAATEEEEDGDVDMFLMEMERQVRDQFHERWCIEDPSVIVILGSNSRR